MIDNILRANSLQAICTNMMAIVLLVTLVINYRRKHYDKRKEYSCFTWMLISNLVQCVVEATTIVLDGLMFPGAVSLCTVLNAVLFTNNIIFSYLWSVYANYRVRFDMKQHPVWRIVRTLPAVCIILGSIANLWTPVFFSVSESNVYGRNMPLCILPIIVTYFYLFLGTATIYIYRKKTDTSNFIPVFTFLFPVCLASVVQFILPPGISLLWAGAAVGLCSAYMSLLDESASMDKLSGLFSRHYLNQYLTTLPNEARGNKQILGIMLDVDDFKSINDTHGHLVGDDAIMAVGHILRKAVPENRMIFRYAGDEFVIIMPIASQDEIENIIAKIHNITEYYNLTKNKPYKIRFSVGYTLYVPGEDGLPFIDRMDAEMYKIKKKKGKLV